MHKCGDVIPKVYELPLLCTQILLWSSPESPGVWERGGGLPPTPWHLAKDCRRGPCSPVPGYPKGPRFAPCLKLVKEQPFSRPSWVTPEGMKGGQGSTQMKKAVDTTSASSVAVSRISSLLRYQYPL